MRSGGGRISAHAQRWSLNAQTFDVRRSQRAFRSAAHARRGDFRRPSADVDRQAAAHASRISGRAFAVLNGVRTRFIIAYCFDRHLQDIAEIVHIGACFLGSLINKFQLLKQESATWTLTYGEMQPDSVFEFFTIELQLTLTFRMGQSQM